MSGNDWNQIGRQTSGLTSSYNVDQNEYKNLDVNLWANESYEIAKNNVYDGMPFIIIYSIGVEEHKPVP